MKYNRYLLALVGLITIALPVSAQETQDKPLIHQVPEDAFVAIYFDDFGNLVRESQQAIALTNENVAEIITNVKEVITGKTLFSISGAPMNPMTWRFDLIMESKPIGSSSSDKHLFTRLDEQVLTPIAKLAQEDIGITVAVVNDAFAGKEQEMRSLTFPGPMPITLYGVEKNGLFFATSDLQGANKFQAEGKLPSRLGLSRGIQPLLEKEDDIPQVAVYAYLGSMVPMWQMMIDAELGAGWTEKLGLDRVESAALTIDWESGKSVIRAAVGLQEGEGGIPEFLAPAMRQTRITELVPDSYPIVLRGAFDSGDAILDRIMYLLSNIDMAIIEEYQEDRESFKGEYGFDWQNDFFANCTDEAMFATRINDDGPYEAFFAVHLDDPNLFESMVSNIGDSTGIDWQMSIYDGASLRSLTSSGDTRMAFAVLDDYLMLAEDTETLKVIIDELSEDQDEKPATGKISKWAKDLPEETAGSAFFDVASILQQIPEREMESAPPFVRDVIEQIIQNKLGLVAYSQASQDQISLSIVMTDDSSITLPAFLIGSVYSSIQASREQACRVISQSNIRGTIQACIIYANDNKNVWPHDLKTLVEKSYIHPTQLISPYDRTSSELTAETIDSHGYYLYRDGTGLQPSDVVMCEKKLHDGGAAFGFADGHTEWIQGQRAEDLLNTMKRYASR